MAPINETEVEQEIKDKGLTAPRITPDDIDGMIKAEAYHVFPGSTVTVCALELQNGFVVVGHSAAASAANFDENLGRKIAFQKAREQIWAFAGYDLRNRLAAGR